jgi:hypothetical protein
VDMPLRLDNAKGVAHMPTAGTTAATIDDEAFKPRFKVDLAASPMPETRQPERLAPRATSNRNGGRDHLGILGEIKSVHPGEIIGISTLRCSIQLNDGRYSAVVRNVVVNAIPKCRSCGREAKPVMQRAEDQAKPQRFGKPSATGRACAEGEVEMTP